MAFFGVADDANRSPATQSVRYTPRVFPSSSFAPWPHRCAIARFVPASRRCCWMREIGEKSENGCTDNTAHSTHPIHGKELRLCNVGSVCSGGDDQQGVIVSMRFLTFRAFRPEHEEPLYDTVSVEGRLSGKGLPGCPQWTSKGSRRESAALLKEPACMKGFTAGVHFCLPSAHQNHSGCGRCLYRHIAEIKQISRACIGVV